MNNTKFTLYYEYIIRNILGALSIVFATVLSNNINHEILSPLAFSLGIIFVIVFDLGLITRAIPSGESFSICLVTLGINSVIATCMGFFLYSFGNFPTTFGGFWSAVATGIVIGFVSLMNKENNKYTVFTTIMLMFSFVYLRLPHCVVCAFYLGTNRNITYNDVFSLFYVVIGNILGGLIIRYSYKLILRYRKEK